LDVTVPNCLPVPLVWSPAKIFFSRFQKLDPRSNAVWGFWARNQSRFLKPPSEGHGVDGQSWAQCLFADFPRIWPFPARSRPRRVSEVSWCRRYVRLDERYSNPARGKPCAKFTRLNVAQSSPSQHIFAHSCSFVLVWCSCASEFAPNEAVAVPSGPPQQRGSGGRRLIRLRGARWRRRFV